MLFALRHTHSHITSVDVLCGSEFVVIMKEILKVDNKVIKAGCELKRND